MVEAVDSRVRLAALERVVPGEGPRPVFLEHIARYEFVLPLVEGAHVLDVACGTGYGSYEMADRGGAAMVVGVDIAQSAIDFCRSHYQAKNLEFVKGDAALLEFPDDSFDIVVSFETIEHLADINGYLDEIYRITKPGGSCLVSTPNKRLSFKNSFHTVEFSHRSFRKIMSKRFSEVRFFGQDHLRTTRRLLLKVSVLASRTIPEGLKRAVVPARVRTDDDTREVGGISDIDVAGCRFFLALCRK